MKIAVWIVMSFLVSLPALAKAPPESTVYVVKGEIMTHGQFMRLHPAQQKAYVKELRTIFVQLGRTSDFFASNARSPLVRALLPQASAQNAAGTLRCMYGGFVVKQDDCVPLRSFGSYSCTQPGEALCNPYLFGDGSGSGLCVRQSRTMTSVCAQRSSAPEQLDRAVELARSDSSGWTAMSTDFNDLCGEQRSTYLRPGLGAKSLSDIDSTCRAAGDRITAATARLSQIQAPPAPAPPAPEPVAAGSMTPPEPPATEVAEVVVTPPLERLDCSGRCQITVVDVAQGGTGSGLLGFGKGRVSGFRRQRYSSDSCGIKIEGRAGGTVDMRNLPSDFPNRLMSLRMRAEPCPNQMDGCQNGAARARGGGYELFARSAGSRKCEIEFRQVGPDQDGIVTEIADDQGLDGEGKIVNANAQKCMGLERTASLRDDDPRVSAYRALTRVLARQNCDLSRIEVVRPGTETDWTRSQNAPIRDCRLRMASNVAADQPVEVRFRPEKGEPYTAQFSNLREGLSEDLLIERLKAHNLCFTSWRERLTHRETQRRQPTSRQGDATR